MIGAIADQHAWKRRFLMFTTIGCIVTTGLLGFIGEGDLIAGVILLIPSLVMFASGENLIAAFLPEIASDQHMGRLSGYGWGLGYVGGLVTLSASLSFITPLEPASLLVYGPGKYRFIDFVRAGLPLTVITLIVLVIVVPMMWPL